MALGESAGLALTVMLMIMTVPKFTLRYYSLSKISYRDLIPKDVQDVRISDRGIGRWYGYFFDILNHV